MRQGLREILSRFEDALLKDGSVAARILRYEDAPPAIP